MDCSLPGPSVHGIFQARVLEWVTIPFSRGSSWPRDLTWVSHIAGRHFTVWATREAPMAEGEELKGLLMKVKEESEKADLKLNIQKTKVIASGPITSWQIDRERMETVTDYILGGSKITSDGDYSHEIKRCLLLGRKVMINLDSILKKQRHYFPNEGPCSQRYGFSRSHVWMWELDYKESWALKNWCFWSVLLEKILVSPLDCQEIQPVYPKGNQSWIFFGRTDAEAEAPILWPPNVKNQLIWKDADAGKDWGQEEKGTTEDEMVGWHHQCDGHEFE